MRLFKKNSEGATRLIRAITVICLIFFSCCVLEAQINRELFIQFEPHGYTISLERLIGLLIVYGACVTPMTIYWIIDGFRKDENNKYM